MSTTTSDKEGVVESILEIKFRKPQPYDAVQELIEEHDSLSDADRENALLAIRTRVESNPESVKKDSNEQRLNIFRLWLNEIAWNSDGTSLPYLSLQWEFPGLYALGFLMDHVCDFAGHAWLHRHSDGHIADFLPDAENMMTRQQPDISIEMLICKAIVPLKKGVPGKVWQRPLREQNSQQIEAWRTDRENPSIAWPVLIPEDKAEEIPESLLTGLTYSYAPEPKSGNHNCLTWAAWVLEFKRQGWFTAEQSKHPDWDAGLESYIFESGKMHKVRRIVCRDI